MLRVLEHTVRGVVSVNAGGHVNACIVSTCLDLANAQLMGFNHAGKLVARLSIDKMEALAAEQGIHQLAVGTFVMKNIQEKKYRFDTIDRDIFRYYGELVTICDIEGGMKKGWDFDSLRKQAEDNATCPDYEENSVFREEQLAMEAPSSHYDEWLDSISSEIRREREYRVSQYYERNPGAWIRDFYG